ncbi:hypothetical protein RchiOBHm_Chr4g0434511 [Rosa chinensis]|uniref:Uncharacterized protein n=1 Tax=Rosa chinensis TaxID=74649 RepID=A0A2P6R1K5_ROSCH|nr:hypothetical protein RchiOBHm_Chr4g0434511 [Rosa chinensis]
MKRRNPLYLLVMFVGFLLFKALWMQLDTSAEFRNGALPGPSLFVHQVGANYHEHDKEISI